MTSKSTRETKLAYDHGEMRLMSIELGVVPWSKNKLVILSLMFDYGIDASVGARVEDIESKEPHPRMDM